MEVVSQDESKFKCRFYNRWNPDIGAESVPKGPSTCKPGLVDRKLQIMAKTGSNND